MHSKLKAILSEKKIEVVRLKQRPAFERMLPNPALRRDFKKALCSPGHIRLIAEIKFASPSAGTIRDREDPVPIARKYEKAGVSALSLLTDRKFFGGDLENLPRLKQAVALPVLRKDFIIDEIQVRESYHYGADALLLIVRILSKEQLKELLQSAREFGLAVLTEVHDQEELELASACGAEIIGINNRNLDTFEVDIRTTVHLASSALPGPILVSESGIRSGEDIRLLLQSGVCAFLVGTAIMQAADMKQKIREFLKAEGKE
jgi:indole-3-glycerol phosphate synthase